jgi:hypothetical protein
MALEPLSRRIGVVGIGVIGASWAAYFLAKGFDVAATDPADGAEKRLRTLVDRFWPALEYIGLAAGASRSRLRFHPEIARAVEGCTFIQENGPERVDVKRDLLARISAVAPSDGLIATSSSGILAQAIYDCGVKPEIELFYSGDIELARDMFADGSLRTPAMASLVLGVSYGFPATTESMLYARNRLPTGVAWTGFGVGCAAFPMLAQTYILGGHVRVGMEDTVYVDRGRLTSGNAELVEKACWLIAKLGGESATSEEARSMLALC